MDGNEIGFAEALKFQARSPKDYAQAQAAKRSSRADARRAKIEERRAERAPGGPALNRQAPPVASFRGIRLTQDGQVVSTRGGGAVEGAQARVDVSGTRDIASRRTMMRTVTPMAFLGQKKMESDTRRCFLVIEGRGWAITEDVPIESEGLARAFAAQLNAAAAAQTPSAYERNPSDANGSARPRPTPAGAEDLASQLTKLSEMQQSGILNAEEFAAAKARLLGTA